MINIFVVITLNDGTNIVLDNKDLISVESNIIDREDIEFPSWGLISNGGKISFLDPKRRILRLAVSGELNKEIKFDIYLRNNINGSGAQIGAFYAKSWDYDPNSLQVNVTLTDGLEKMQEIAFAEVRYDLSLPITNITLASIAYDYFAQKAIDNGFNMLRTANNNFDQNTLDFFDKFSIPIAYADATNLWRAIDNYANAFQLHTYKNRRGEIVSVYRDGD